jgi:hypothetical protein
VDLLYTLEVPVTGAAATGGGATDGGGGGGAPEQKPATFNLLQNATIAAIVAEPAAAEAGTAKAGAILFTVSPQDALVLKHVKDAGAILDVVVRAPGNENPSNAEPVDLDYIINRYRIPTGGGR